MTPGRSERYAILLVGVGGQGVLTAAKILGDAAHAAGRTVVVGQLHGMAQRGGSVECSVIVGPGEGSHAPHPDIVVAFEQLEVLRARHRMGPETRVLLNQARIVPFSLNREGRTYPPLAEVVGSLQQITSLVTVIDGSAAVTETGLARALNVFVLGALAGAGGLLPFIDQDTLWSAIARRCGGRFEDANRRAFELGCQAGADTPREDSRHVSE